MCRRPRPVPRFGAAGTAGATLGGVGPDDAIMPPRPVPGRTTWLGEAGAAHGHRHGRRWLTGARGHLLQRRGRGAHGRRAAGRAPAPVAAGTDPGAGGHQAQGAGPAAPAGHRAPRPPVAVGGCPHPRRPSPGPWRWARAVRSGLPHQVVGQEQARGSRQGGGDRAPNPPVSPGPFPPAPKRHSRHGPKTDEPPLAPAMVTVTVAGPPGPLPVDCAGVPVQLALLTSSTRGRRGPPPPPSPRRSGSGQASRPGPGRRRTPGRSVPPGQ